MKEWKYIKIADLVDSKKYSCVGGPFGSNLISEDYIAAPGVPVIRGNNFVLGSGYFYEEDFVFVSDEKADSLFQNTAYPGDLVFTQRGTIGNVALIPNDAKFQKYLLSQNLMKLSVDSEKADPRFICYYFLSPKIQKTITRNSVGSTIPGFNLTQLRDFPVFLPDLKEQTEIADILFSLDRKIENLRKQNETLETIAQTLFKHWFVDFEFPNEDGKPYKSSGGEMVQSELGGIPIGWRVGRLGDVVINYDKKRVPLASAEREARKGSYPYYGASSVMDYVDDYIFDGTYVLMGEDGTVIDSEGFPVLQYVFGRFWANNHAHVLQGKNGYSTNLVYLLLKKTKINNIVTGAVQLKINQANMNSINLTIPSSEILLKLDRITTPIFEKLKLNIKQIQTLIRTRDGLLPKLMSGKLRISE